MTSNLSRFKVGDYIKAFWSSSFYKIEKINIRSITTTSGMTLYEKELNNYIVYTEQEMKLYQIALYSEQIEKLLDNFENLKEVADRYIDVDAIVDDIDEIIVGLKEVLGE